MIVFLRLHLIIVMHDCPSVFSNGLDPTPVANPSLVRLNIDLARQLNLNPEFLASVDGIELLAGNTVPAGAEPLAMAYAGHQFGGWVPQLGDGRAVLLGEIIDKHGCRQDIQLKGAGRTAYSRSGDGRAWLGPVIREFIVSESMAVMGVPTTRALAAVDTGEKIRREGLMPGAVLTRVARSHIRVGTFQYFAARDDADALRTLSDYVIARHYPDAANATNSVLAMLEAIIKRQAALIAHWQSIGFIHGVMNTDNMSIAGDTIDYGPCAFMDTYHPDKVFSSIDHAGRYAFSNQPRAAQWNLACLAQSLLPIVDTDQQKAISQVQAIVDTFPVLFAEQLNKRMGAKIGLTTSQPGDIELINDLLECMADNHADFTLTFRGLSLLTSDAVNSTKKKATIHSFIFLTIFSTIHQRCTAG